MGRFQIEFCIEVSRLLLLDLNSLAKSQIFQKQTSNPLNSVID